MIFRSIGEAVTETVGFIVWQTVLTLPNTKSLPASMSLLVRPGCAGIHRFRLGGTVEKCMILVF